MATYKVPQDVEADDKLIGPFSFRQFIYLIIVALAGVLAWGLSQLFIGLVIVPLPVILLFGALALPLRKDQPMEIYLAAIISFYLKPHKRLWDPDGVESLIEITVPKIVEVQRSKNITQEDAEQRFSYLANIVDSGGWAIRGTGAQSSGSTTINNDVFLEAQSAEDVFDNNTSIARSFNTMMSQESDRIRQEAMDRMRQPVVAPPAPTTPAPVAQPAIQQPTTAPVTNPASAYTIPTPAPQAPQAPQVAPVFNPYPTDIQQTVIQPIDDNAHSTSQPAAPVTQPVATPIAQEQTTPTTSDTPPSTDIMNLANNPDLSIESIARQARRIQEKENDMSEEVVISLR